MQFFVDTNLVKIRLSQGEAAQLLLYPQPDYSEPKVCENLSRLLRRAAVDSGQSIPKGEFSVSVSDREEKIEITLTRLGVKQGQRQVWRFWESEQMIRGCICLHRQLCHRMQESPLESSLYTMPGTEGQSSFYCLCLSLPAAWEKKAECILLEYAQKAKHPLLAQGVLAERAVCLVQKKAVERIAESFGRSG